MHRHGRDEILAELLALHETRFRATRIRDLGHSVRFLSPGIAIVHLRWEMQGDPGQPGHPSQNGIRRGIFTHVVQSTPEGWRIVVSQNTDIAAIPDILERRPEPARAGAGS